jgi:hypothetical protein
LQYNLLPLFFQSHFWPSFTRMWEPGGAHQLFRCREFSASVQTPLVRRSPEGEGGEPRKARWKGASQPRVVSRRRVSPKLCVGGSCKRRRKQNFLHGVTPLRTPSCWGKQSPDNYRISGDCPAIFFLRVAAGGLAACDGRNGMEFWGEDRRKALPVTF